MEQGRVNRGSTMMYSLGWRWIELCGITSEKGGKHREAETKDGGRKMWRRQRGEAASMEASC